MRLRFDLDTCGARTTWGEVPSLMSIAEHPLGQRQGHCSFSDTRRSDKEKRTGESSSQQIATKFIDDVIVLVYVLPDHNIRELSLKRSGKNY